MTPDITQVEGQLGIKPIDQLVNFLCGNDSQAAKMMRGFKPQQIIDRPFRVSSLVYQQLLRGNEGLQKLIFEKNLPVHLDNVKEWIEVLSVIPEGMAFHPDIPKETFPFLNEKLPRTDYTPFRVLDSSSVLLYFNNYQGEQGNTGFMLSPGYRHLSLADRLNDPAEFQRWNSQNDLYLRLARDYLQTTELERTRVFLEPETFHHGQFTALDFHRVFAREEGRELTTEEEQAIVKESLEDGLEYSNGLIKSFEKNRNGLKEFEDRVWEMISKIT